MTITTAPQRRTIGNPWAGQKAFNVGYCPHGFRQYFITGGTERRAWHSMPRDPREGEAWADIGEGIRIYLCDAAASPSLAEVLA